MPEAQPTYLVRGLVAASRPAWTDEEKRRLADAIRQLASRLKRRLRPMDLRRIRIRGRSFHAVKGQAARMGLYAPAPPKKRWTAREEQILLVLAKTRRLGARGIKNRGFFSGARRAAASWTERSIDAIAQKKRREGYVDPERSRRARSARRLSADEKLRMRRELRASLRVRTTEDIAREYGIAASTVRNYRQKWGIRLSWREAMELPAALARRRALAESMRSRGVEMWKERKGKLLRRLEKLDRKLRERAAAAGGGRRRVARRVCERCGREWAALPQFFAPCLKRSGGKIIKRYLRRTCRVCPRRAKG